MIDPPITSLLQKVDTRYTLCVLAGKRARQLTSGSRKLTNCNSQKAVTIAIHEINDNLISYTRTKSGIK